MKYLVEDPSQEVRSGFQFPLRSSVSGHFVVDVPNELGVVVESSSLVDLVDSKITAYQRIYTDLTGVLNDEFLDASGVDTTALSSGFIAGGNKGVALLPGGHFQTPVMTIMSSFSKVFFHLSLFTLFRESPGIFDPYPGPSRTLYGYDATLADFVEPSPSLVQASIMDSTGASELLAMTSDFQHSFAQSGPFNFRMRFTNTSVTQILYLSDWLLLHN
jgi:hypothetical protein